MVVHRGRMHTRSGTTQTQHALVAAFAERPFTSAEAEAVGITSRRLRGAVAVGKVRRIRTRLYVASPTLVPRQHLLKVQGDLRERGVPSVIGVRSAADVWGIPVLGSSGPLPSPEPTLVVPRGVVRPGLRGGVHYLAATVPPAHVTHLPDGLVLTSPLRAAVDVVRLLRLPRRLGIATMNAGLRAYYFSFALLGWFVSPLAMVIATTVVVAILYSREFRSEVLHILRD